MSTFKIVINFFFLNKGNTLTSAIFNIMKKQLDSQYGKFEFYEFYVVLHLSCDFLTKNIAKKILTETEDFYKGTPYVFISHRIVSSCIDPEAYCVINSDNLVGIAVVSEDVQVHYDAINEMPLYSGAFGFFKSLGEAEVWVVDVIAGL